MRKQTTESLCLSLAMTLAWGCGEDVEKATPGGTADKCNIAADCVARGGSASSVCNAGVCEDPVWGCIGEADDRPAAGATATFRVGLNDLTAPFQGTVGARACNATSEDPLCAQPIPGTTASYDPSQGLITVNGLPADKRFRLAVEPSGAFMPIDFYPQRTPRGETVEKIALSTLSTSLLQTLGSSYNPPIVPDPQTTHVMALVLDCEGELASGVTLELEEGSRSPDTRIMYLGSNTLPDPTLMQTSAIGSAVAINVPVGQPIRVKARLGTKDLQSSEVYGVAGHLTAVTFYPRKY